MLSVSASGAQVALADENQADALSDWCSLMLMHANADMVDALPDFFLTLF